MALTSGHGGVMDKRLLLGGVAISLLLVGAWIAHDPSSDVVKVAWRSLPSTGGFSRVTVPRYRPWSMRQQRRAGAADLLVMQLAADELTACGLDAELQWSWRGVLHLDGSPDIDVQDVPEEQAGCVHHALGLWPLAAVRAENELVGLAWRGTLAEVTPPWGRCFSAYPTVEPVDIIAEQPAPDGVIWRVDLDGGALVDTMAWPPGSSPAPTELPFATSDALTRGTWRCLLRGETR